MNNEKRKLKKLDDELWKEVPNSNGRYFVSNYGRVKSFAVEKENGHIMKSYVINGFKSNQLIINKEQKRYYLHKLVAEVWIERPSKEHTFVTHLDRNLNNNHFSNLKWLTQEEIKAEYSIFFKERYKNMSREKMVVNSKLSEEDVRVLKSFLAKGVVQSKIAKMFCISEMQVTRIKRGDNWAHIQI